MEENNIFDKIMHLSGIKIYYKKYKEVLLYLFFGGLTTLISILIYAFFNVLFGVNELIANMLSWIISVAFAFFTNRIWVFAASTCGALEFMKQMGSFYGGRVLTLILEELILFFFISLLHYNSMLIKILAQVVVIVLNYVISKLWVFKKHT